MNYYELGAQNALTKFAATLPELRAAADRIPGVIRVAPETPGLPKRMYRSMAATGTPFASPMLMPPLTPAQSKRMGKDWTALQGKILAPPEGSLASREAFTRSFMPPGTPPEEMPPTAPKWMHRGADSIELLHEAAERKAFAKNRALPRINSHKDMSVVLNDNNIAAGLRGRGSATLKKHFLKDREAEGATTSNVIQQIYGKQHTFGESKIPKAMRKDILRHLEEMPRSASKKLMRPPGENAVPADLETRMKASPL
jgi:hypothetical protein